MSVLWRRLGSKEIKAVEGVGLSPQNSSCGSSDPIEKDTGKLGARDVQEAEANRRLSVFERSHRWDPNLDDNQLDKIDDAVNLRDPNAKGKIYEEVFENSPYPEVCPRTFSFPSLFISIFLSYHSMPNDYDQVRAAVRNYDEDLQSIRFVRGRSDCC